MNQGLYPSCPARGRLQKYAHFQLFADEAEVLFDQLFKLATIDRNQYIVRVGGLSLKGGKDKRLIEIAFNKRHYDTIEIEDPALKVGDVVRQNAPLLEVGTSMTYQRRDNGDVVCLLYPARTDESKEQEDLIVLDYIIQPCHLPMLAADHFHDLLAYRACTTIDGNPSLWQLLRCSYLRHFKQRGVDFVCRPARAPSWLKQLAIFTVGAAAGGLITKAVERRFFPEDKKPFAESRPDNSSKALSCCRIGEKECQPESNLNSRYLI